MAGPPLPPKEPGGHIGSAVDEAIARWRAEPGAAPAGPPKSKKKRRRAADAPTAASGSSPPASGGTKDEALAYIDELAVSPLGRAWIEPQGGLTPALPPKRAMGVVAPLPRRVLIAPSATSTGVPSMATNVDVDITMLRVVLRVFVWIWGYLRYNLGNAYDSVRGRSTVRRRAVRFRLVLESMGATFIKLGQQLAVRADMLPYEFCEELSLMLDKVKPFPSDAAIAIVERQTGKPIGEVFEVFDPVPIGSGSLACVYQAVLHGGDKVAVKVRRPGIRKVLAADLRAFGILVSLAEMFTLVRSGTAKNLRYELSGMLMEETDFRREGRYTEIFRLEAERNNQVYVSAPTVYHELTSDEILVTEYVTGVFLSEILAVIDRGDTATLAALRDRGISPEVVAQRLVMAFNWETLENVLFHADPHPANIVVKDDNSLVFIDFGSCGRMGSKSRRHWRQFHYYLSNEDVAGLTDVAVAMLEPLPPIDLAAFKKEVESLYWDWVYAMKTDSAQWWEKASGVTWMKFIAISRRYRVPLNLDTLKGLRVTFLFDTIVFRLHRGLDLSDEYRRYARRAGKRARKRVLKSARRRMTRGPSDYEFIAWEDSANMNQQLKGRIQHFLDTPAHNFGSVIDKAYYGLTVLLQILAIGIGLHLVLVTAFSVYNYFTGAELDLWSTMLRLAKHPLYQFVPLTLLLLAIRKVLVRVSDPDRV